MNTSLTLLDIYRTQYVKRWHIVQSKRQQTLAEHSYMVTMLTTAVMDELGIKDPDTRILAMEWALVHDLSEVVMGDTVSPIKRRAKKLFDEMEYLIDKKGKDFELALPELVKTIVKVADYIDALKFIKCEGTNGQAISIYKRLYSDFCEFLDLACKNKQDIEWYRCHNILEDILTGEENFIDNIV